MSGVNSNKIFRQGRCAVWDSRFIGEARTGEVRAGEETARTARAVRTARAGGEGLLRSGRGLGEGKDGFLLVLFFHALF